MVLILFALGRNLTTPKEVKMKKSLLTVKEVSVWLNLTERSVYRLIQSGKVKAIRLGRLIRIKTDDINDIINSSK